MAKFIRKLEEVDAIQWNVGDDLLEGMEKHEGAFIGDVYYIDINDEVHAVRDGDWIVTESDGYQKLLNPEEFKKAYMSTKAIINILFDTCVEHISK